MSVAVIVSLVPQPERRAELVAAIERALPRFHAEEGCELYALLQNGEHLVLLQKWDSVQTLDAHDEGEALHELLASLTGKLAAPFDVQRLHVHPIGSTAQGTL